MFERSYYLAISIKVCLYSFLVCLFFLYNRSNGKGNGGACIGEFGSVLVISTTNYEKNVSRSLSFNRKDFVVNSQTITCLKKSYV